MCVCRGGGGVRWEFISLYMHKTSLKVKDRRQGGYQMYELYLSPALYCLLFLPAFSVPYSLSPPDI